MAKKSKKKTRKRATVKKEAKTALIPIERIDSSILQIRGQRVMLDADLAQLYGVPTKRLNEQGRRNTGRFPEDFRFQLTDTERDEVVANCDHLQNLKYSPVLPWAFTKHGAIMAANVLNSSRAVEVSILVVRAFVRLRHILTTHKDLARKIETLEKRFDHRSTKHEAHIRQIYKLLEGLMSPPEPKRKPIGYATEAETK